MGRGSYLAIKASVWAEPKQIYPIISVMVSKESQPFNCRTPGLSWGDRVTKSGRRTHTQEVEAAAR